MNLKIDKKLLKDLNNIAEMEYSTPETVLIRGLIIYVKYAHGLNLAGSFKGKERIKNAEKYIENLAETYGTNTNEIVFGCIDAYRAKVMGKTVNERFETSGRNEIYLFIDDPYMGSKLFTHKKEYRANNLQEIMKLKREQDRIESEEILENFIENARIMLSQSEQELKQMESYYRNTNDKYTKITNEHRLLSVTEVFKLTAQKRISHNYKLENKRRELAELSVIVTKLNKELEYKKDEISNLKRDINEMKTYFDLEEIPVWTLKDEYKPKKNKY